MKIGSLFSGYGGLDMGVQAVLGGEVAWNVEYDSAPSKVLEHHWPGVPNYGDVTTLDWSTVEPIDALTAGYPCQPFSQAGKRKGSNDARHLWPYVLDAIRHLRPRIVVLENVKGHLTLGFDRVLGDLAEAGYDAEWLCIPAAAAGAPHRRERIFILAYPEDVGHEWAGPAWNGRDGSSDSGGSPADSGRDESERRGIGGYLGGTSTADERASGERKRIWDAARDSGSASTDSERGGDLKRHGGSDVGGWAAGSEQVGVGDWGYYESAIRRWEPIVGRHAPAATVPDGRDGKHRLSARFVEWMMGLPAGHVTDVGITRNEQLKALGNGVVPQQAELALRTLLEHEPHNRQPEGAP